ncbi:MAG: type II toxin-antitoxin system ParD family antitoxin [Gammaproteobacteria bacterium]|nr:type II toxin-antitoxin system ParD family antitoxin [Gammaproteobacteria bacterium]MDE2260960.1 type II toxin-antitoxin system ParD family antitoxin [Gammaproteobacteria bacterium]
MNVSLTPELEQYIRRKVDSGLYSNASEVVREALRLLVGREGGGVQREPPQKESIHAQLKALEKPLRERGLTALALFGSTARGTARLDSDVDVLIDVAPQVRFSLVDLVSLKDLLEDRLGRAVDVVTREGLDPAIRDRVIREARAVF